VEDVVDEDHDLVVDALRWDLGRGQRAGRPHPEVVAVHGHVDGPDRDLGALDLGDLRGDPSGQVDAAAGDAEQDEVAGALVALEDLVGDTGQRPGDVTGVEDGSSGSLDLVVRLDRLQI